METGPTPAEDGPQDEHLPPDEHLEEQLESIEIVEQWADQLREEAAHAAEQFPGVEVVGLVMQKGSPDAPKVQAILGLPAEAVAGRGFVVVVPRHLAVQVVTEVAPPLLDWLDDPTGEDPPRLAVVALLPHGARVGFVRR